MFASVYELGSLVTPSYKAV